MGTEVAELNPQDIQRGGGVSAGGDSQPGFAGSEAQAPMGANQQAALKEVERLRGEYGKTPADGRDSLAQRISKLQSFAFGIGEKPADFMPGEQPAPDMRPHDPLSESLSDAGKVITQQERDFLVVHAKNLGVDAEAAAATAEFCAQAGLDRVTAKAITDRVAEHYANGWGVSELTATDHAALTAECVRRFGSPEKAQAENGLARAYVEHVGLAEFVDKYAGSLAYDPATILALAFKARCLGLQPK